MSRKFFNSEPTFLSNYDVKVLISVSKRLMRKNWTENNSKKSIWFEIHAALVDLEFETILLEFKLSKLRKVK